MKQELKNYIKEFALDSRQSGQVENDLSLLKDFIAEDFPETSNKDLDEAVNLYVSIAW